MGALGDWLGCCIGAAVRSLSSVLLFDPRDCSTPGFPLLLHFPELAQAHVSWVDEAIQPPHPLSSPSPPAFNLSQHQGLFQWVSSSNQVAQSIGVSASASVLPLNIQGWFPLGFPFFAVKGILKCILQQHNSKASVLWCSVFFMVRLSYPYMTTGRTIALTIRTFSRKVIKKWCFLIHYLVWS